MRPSVPKDLTFSRETVESSELISWRMPTYRMSLREMREMRALEEVEIISQYWEKAFAEEKGERREEGGGREGRQLGR